MRELASVPPKIRLSIKKEDIHNLAYEEGRCVTWKDEDGLAHRYKIVRKQLPTQREQYGSIYCDFYRTSERPN